MVRRSRTFRLTAWLAATSFLATGILAGTPVARAQDTAGQNGPAQIAVDPPARVGRLARLQGSVSTHGPGATQWTPAVLNFPFVSGDSLWTQPQAQADVELGASLATLADNTEFDLATLDEHSLAAAEPQGAVFLDLRDVRPGDTYTIDTPRGAVQIAADGEYEILAGDSGTPTRVVVVRGAAQLTSGSLALRAGQGQMAVATGDQDVSGDVEAVSSYDPFLTAMLARNSAPLNEPQAVQQMTGTEGLAQYGSWQQNPDYGEVWYPQVAPGWVPYTEGSWSYVEPWGWTWIDNEPWGFAPFHYGRWAQAGGRWCWLPGQGGAEPVYAPALVDFIAAGAAAGLIAASLRSGRGDIGWVPLGPHEAYAPPYGGSRRYIGRLNPGGGWHRPEWGNGQAHGGGGNVFANRGALTIAPATAMIRSQQIRPLAHGMGSPAARSFQTAAVQPLRGPLPVRPAAETRGLTPAAAQRLGLASSPSHPAAPGPAINPAILHPAALPGGRVPFRGAAAPTGTHEAHAPAAGPALPRGPKPRAPIAPRTPGPPQVPHPEVAHPAISHPAGPAMPALRPAPPRGVPQHEGTPRAAEPPRAPAFRPEQPRETIERPAPAVPHPPMPAMQQHAPMAQPRFNAPHAIPAPHAAAPPRAAPQRAAPPRAAPQRAAPGGHPEHP